MADLFWLTDAHMKRLKPFFPLSHALPRLDYKRVLSGITFISRNGLSWRDAPAVYCPHKTLNGPVPVSFRSFESNTRHPGDWIWQ